MKVLFVTNCYPNPQMPWHGIFVKREIDTVSLLGVDSKTVIIQGHKSKIDYLRSIGQINLDVDIIHSYYGYSGLVTLGRTLVSSNVVKVISFLGDDILGTSKVNGSKTQFSLLTSTLNKRLAGRFNAIIVQSEEMADALPPSVKTKCFVLPFGIDFDVFKPLNKLDCRKKLGLHPDKKYILFPANPDIPTKNFKLFKDAVEKIKDAETLILKGVKEPDVPILFNAADVITLCSFSEGSPTVIKEAMACERPVVSTNVGNVRTLFGNLEGHLISTYDPKDMANKIEIVAGITKTKARERLSALGLELKQAAVKLINLYKSLI